MNFTGFSSPKSLLFLLFSSFFISLPYLSRISPNPPLQVHPPHPIPLDPIPLPPLPLPLPLPLCARVPRQPTPFPFRDLNPFPPRLPVLFPLRLHARVARELRAVRDAGPVGEALAEEGQGGVGEVQLVEGAAAAARGGGRGGGQGQDGFGDQGE